MSDPANHLKLLAFAGHRSVADADGLRAAIRAELLQMKGLLGSRMTAICGAAPGADLVFLRACVELRIPAILILPFAGGVSTDISGDGHMLSEHLRSVALAEYPAPETRPDVDTHLLEWADAFLFAWDGTGGGKGETVADAQSLGIPSRIIEAAGLEPRWHVPMEANRRPRHGFDTRADLLDFLDARFALESQR